MTRTGTLPPDSQSKSSSSRGGTHWVVLRLLPGSNGVSCHGLRSSSLGWRYALGGHTRLSLAAGSYCKGDKSYRQERRRNKIQCTRQREFHHRRYQKEWL